MVILTGFCLLAFYGGYRALTCWLRFQLRRGPSWERDCRHVSPRGCRAGYYFALDDSRRCCHRNQPALATILQPVVQVVAAIPATALFPVVLLALLQAPGGLNIAAMLLMLMGTQWYLAVQRHCGAAAIPQDLRDTTDLLRLSSLDRWRTLILPALFPYIITGAITASGGAWNASIVAEHVEFGGQTHATTGVGALIAKATGTGTMLCCWLRRWRWSSPLL